MEGVKNRRLRVSYIWHGEKQLPYLKLSGKWFQEVGFLIGSRVSVHAEHGQITIKIAVDENPNNISCNKLVKVLKGRNIDFEELRRISRILKVRPEDLI